jgi:hypothetical protein
MQALTGIVPGQWRDPDQGEDVVEGEYHEEP